MNKRFRRLVVRQTGPEDRFPKQWKWHPDERALVNGVLGVRFQVVDVVYEDNSEVHHEGVMLCSRRIELHVIIRQTDGAIGLVWHRREKVVPTAISDTFFSVHPERPCTFSQAEGIEEYECPHGLAIVAGEEAEEETGRKIVRSVPVGHIKESPPFGGVAHMLFATVVDDDDSGKRPEPGEQIMGFRFFPPEDVRSIPTICGVTQAALWRFRAWGLSQAADSFFWTVAVRL